MDGPLLWVVVVLSAIVLAAIAVALVDLRRREVRHLPKWAWAVVIVFVQFPVGVLLYLILGRVPPAESAAPGNSTIGQPPVPDHPDGIALSEPEAAQPSSIPADAVPADPPVIATTAVRKAYGDTVALDGVDLEVPRGRTYGLIGPNGAGKTTMLSILSGLRHPSSGEVYLGVERRRLAVLVDTPLFEPWLTAREVVDLARHLVADDLPRDHVDTALEEVGLAHAADRRTGGFSRGMLQRLGLAACLVGDPEVLFLDEPSSALDPAGRREVLDLIGRLSRTKTILLSTHILGDVQQVCDVVGVIDQGHLRFQGPIHELLARTSSAYLVHVRGDSEGLVGALAEQAWVETVEELAPGRVRLVTTDAPTAERELPRLVAAQGVGLASFYPATDLETAFLELTR